MLVEVYWRLVGVELDDPSIAYCAIIGYGVVVTLDGHINLRAGKKCRRSKPAILTDANHLPFSL